MCYIYYICAGKYCWSSNSWHLYTWFQVGHGFQESHAGSSNRDTAGSAQDQRLARSLQGHTTQKAGQRRQLRQLAETNTMFTKLFWNRWIWCVLLKQRIIIRICKQALNLKERVLVVRLNRMWHGWMVLFECTEAAVIWKGKKVYIWCQIIILSAYLEFWLSACVENAWIYYTTSDSCSTKYVKFWCLQFCWM